MKHVVHVDSDWFTGQGLCESTMRLFPSATFTNSPIGVNTDRCRDISSGSYCGPQVRPFMNTKSDSNVADKPYVKSVHIGSCENTTADLRSHEQRYTNAQMSGRHFQRNFNRLPRKSNFIRKYENKNNLDYLQKSSNHSVGFSNFFTSTNSNHVNDDFECNGLYNSLAVISSIVDSSNDCLNAPLEALHLGDGISPHNLFKRHLTVSSVQHDLRRNRLPVHYNSKVIQSKLGIDIPMRNSNSPLFSERRRSASGPVASYIADGKKDDCLLIDSNESSIKGIPNDLLYIICNPFLPSLKFCYAGQRSRRSLSTTTPSATSDFRSDLDNSAENPCPSKVVRISAVESVLLSAFRLAASFCFWAVEPDINEAKANTLIPKNPAPLSSNRHLGNNLHLNTSFELQSSLSHIKCKNTSRGIGNTSLLFGQNESDFKHVFSSNAAHQNDKRKYKFSIQDTRRIRSADRRHNSKYNTSSTCPVCVNMGLNSIDPCETFLDHQVEFGDPHSPFLGMLAGSGRRPNLLAYNNNRAAIEADNSNSVFSPQYKMENYFSYQHEDLLTDNDQVVCKLHSHDQQQHTHSTRQSNCNSYNDLCPRNQKEMYEKSKVTGKINCAFQCSHLSVCVDCCQNNSQNKNIELTAYNRTPLPHISSPSQLTSCWSFEHCKTLDNNDFSSSNSFLSPRKLSAEYQSSIISDVLKSVDKSSVPESFGTCLSLTNRNSTNQYSHFSVSMNPVGMSRDAYLKATQDGFLNRTVYEPPIDAKLFCSSYSNRTSQANSLKRSKDEQSFPNSCVYPNIHESFLHNDLGSESESEFDQYGDVYQLDYSNLILHSPSVSPVNSQQPANQSASSTSQLNISDISQSRYEFLHNPNVNIHAHPDEDDRITLVPIESEGTNNINQLSQPTNNPRNEEAFVGICDSNSSSNNSSKKVLHRSQAIRERHRPPFLTLFRNRSLPSCVDNESPGLESRSFLLYSPSDSTSHDIHQQKSRGPESPCGPFVSLHSTFL
ncbi:unnamed protein product [Heterobilharzia americana]|nr:unnamed protein product [Heterobilharzia americana]